MDVFDKELLRLWEALNKNNVLYIMVGGVATNLHGYSRGTEDVDIWIEDTLTNRRGIRKAFADCGMGDFEPLERMPFVPGWTYFHLNNGIRLDLMTNMKSPVGELSFDECYKMASIADIDGVKIPFLHINHLIANKKAVARLKDQLDVQELEKIQKLQQEDNNLQAL